MRNEAFEPDATASTTSANGSAGGSSGEDATLGGKSSLAVNGQNQERPRSPA